MPTMNVLVGFNNRTVFEEPIKVAVAQLFSFSENFVFSLIFEGVVIVDFLNIDS